MNVLFLAYYFPPDSSSGSFRPFFFANHLAKSGVGVHVLTAKVEDFLPEQPLDSSLSDKLNPSVEVTRCSVWRPREAVISLRNRFSEKTDNNDLQRKIPDTTLSCPASTSLWQICKDTITDFLATPDPHVGWIFDCVKHGKAFIAAKRPDVIYATASPWSGLLAGMLLKKATGVPLILDFRDPWASNPNFSRRGRLFRAIDVRLEKMVVEAADGLIANTPTLRDDFLVKYPKLDKNRVISITNGFEEYIEIPQRRLDQPLTITHTGALYFSRNPAPLLEAVKRVIEQGMIAPSEFRLQFIGGIDAQDAKVSTLLADGTVRQVVTIVPRVSYDDSQRYVCEADVLLLVQPDFPLQIPRKLYEYMAVRKPMLCIAEPASATGVLVRDNLLGTICNNTVAEIEAVLCEIITTWKSGSLKLFTDDRCDRFLNSDLTAQLLDLMLKVTNQYSVPHP